MVKEEARWWLPLSSGWEPYKQFVGDGDHLLYENLLIVSLSKGTLGQKTQNVFTYTPVLNLD